MEHIDSRLLALLFAGLVTFSSCNKHVQSQASQRPDPIFGSSKLFITVASRPNYHDSHLCRIMTTPEKIALTQSRGTYVFAMQQFSATATDMVIEDDSDRIVQIVPFNEGQVPVYYGETLNLTLSNDNLDLLSADALLPPCEKPEPPNMGAACEYLFLNQDQLRKVCAHDSDVETDSAIYPGGALKAYSYCPLDCNDYRLVIAPPF